MAGTVLRRLGLALLPAAGPSTAAGLAALGGGAVSRAASGASASGSAAASAWLVDARLAAGRCGVPAPAGDRRLRSSLATVFGGPAKGGPPTLTGGRPAPPRLSGFSSGGDGGRSGSWRPPANAPPTFFGIMDKMTSTLDGAGTGVLLRRRTAAPTELAAPRAKGLTQWLMSLRRLRARWEQLTTAKRHVATKAAKIPVLSVRSTSNNNFLVLMAPDTGTVLAAVSGGTAGFKGSRKSSAYAAQAVGEAMSAKCLKLGYRTVRVQLSGLGFGKRSAVRGLRAGGLKMLSLEELTSIPFNGCRAPKKRRL